MKQPKMLSRFEMEMILNLRMYGDTHKEIKLAVDKYRRIEGTYKGKGISTNTISRLLGKTHGEGYKEKIVTSWRYYEQGKYVSGEIRSDKTRAKFEEAYKAVNRKKDDKHVMITYQAEDDSYVINSV